MQNAAAGNRQENEEARFFRNGLLVRCMRSNRYVRLSRPLPFGTWPELGVSTLRSTRNRILEVNTAESRLAGSDSRNLFNCRHLSASAHSSGHLGFRDIARSDATTCPLFQQSPTETAEKAEMATTYSTHYPVLSTTCCDRTRLFGSLQRPARGSQGEPTSANPCAGRWPLQSNEGVVVESPRTSRRRLRMANWLRQVNGIATACPSLR